MDNNSKDYFDNVSWHFEDAYDGYCKRFNCEDDEENGDNIKAGTIYAATHIGIYMAWIIKHNFEGEIHKKNSKEDLEKVRNEEMTGTEFLLKNCGGKLLSIDLNEEGLEFTRDYYNYYLEDYADLILCIYDIEYSVYEVEDKWSNYKEISDMLDDAYEDFKEEK